MLTLLHMGINSIERKLLNNKCKQIYINYGIGLFKKIGLVQMKELLKYQFLIF